MIVQTLRPDGSVARSMDTDSYVGERLNVALLEYYLDRVDLGSNHPEFDDRTRDDYLRQAAGAWALLNLFFPGATVRRH